MELNNFALFLKLEQIIKLQSGFVAPNLRVLEPCGLLDLRFPSHEAIRSIFYYHRVSPGIKFARVTYLYTRGSSER